MKEYNPEKKQKEEDTQPDESDQQVILSVVSIGYLLLEGSVTPDEVKAVWELDLEKASR